VKRLTTAFRDYVAVSGQWLMATCEQIDQKSFVAPCLPTQRNIEMLAPPVLCTYVVS
jgi:hypothetical protein